MPGWPDGKIDMNMAPYHCKRDELSVQGRCVLWHSRVLIPSQCRQEVLHELHNEESRTLLSLVPSQGQGDGRNCSEV